MRRTAIAVAIVLGACSNNSQQPVDARMHDARIGSGAAGRESIEASPADRGLELGTLASGLVVVMAPLGLRRRRIT